MGVIWSAEDTVLERKVALKSLLQGFDRDKQRLDLFQREAKLLASLNHCNIASIHGLERAEGSRLLVLEWSDGRYDGFGLAEGSQDCRTAAIHGS